MATEHEFTEAWENLTNPTEALQLSYLVRELPDPVGFIREKLVSTVDSDRLWATWMSSGFPGCEEELMLLVDDPTEIGEVAALALALLELNPENEHTVLQDMKASNDQMDVLHLGLRWQHSNQQDRADQLFREKRYSEFFALIENYLPALNTTMQRRAVFARSRLG